MKIDKSKFSVEELKQYEALIAKAVVPEEEECKKDSSENAGETEEEKKKESPDAEKPDNKPPAEPNKPVEKATSSPAPELTAAMERLEKLEKTIERAQFTDIAKKYAILGEKESELADTLYRLQKSDPESYKAYVAILDKQLDLVQKSGLFTEIGKSGSGAGVGGSVIDRIEAAASEIQKSDPSLSRTQAIAKAWDNNPELAIEYDNEYSKGV